MDTFLLSLHNLLDRGLAQRDADPRPAAGLSFHISGPGGTRRVSLGGPPTIRPPPRTASDGPVPSMSDFLRGTGPPADRDGRTITSQMMAQYLLALMGNRDPLANGFPGTGPGSGRMGDYVYNQEALDEIITQLMETSNAHRPVPATEEIMAKLPREVLTVGSTILTMDCAVCKEQFALETEDPDEQIAVTLPCKHPFHQPCIIPWLKSSGTCPVCRFALIAQPSHPTSPGAQPASPTAERTSQSSHSPPHPSSGGGSGFMQNLFSHFTGGAASGSSSTQSHRNANSRQSSYGSSSSSGHRRSQSDTIQRRSDERRRDDHRDNIPGGWEDDLD